MRKFLLHFIKTVGLILLLILVILMLFYRGDISPDVLFEKYADKQSFLLKIDGLNVHVKIKGRGEPIFLIHGSFSSLNTWEGWEEELNEHFTTISMDLPGHGLTGPDIQKRYSISDYTQIVFGIADHLGYKEFHLAGNSMGGGVALKMASDHPERILSLNLISSSGAPKETDKKTLSTDSSAPIFKLARHPIFSELLLKCTPKFLFKINLKQVFYDDSKISDRMVNRYYELLLRSGNRQATIDRLTMNTETEFRYENLNMPVLIMWGKEDRWIPLAHGKRLSESIPNSRLKVFEKVGHVPMEEIPTESVREYLSFLGIEQERDYFSIPKFYSYVP